MNRVRYVVDQQSTHVERLIYNMLVEYYNISRQLEVTIRSSSKRRLTKQLDAVRMKVFRYIDRQFNTSGYECLHFNVLSWPTIKTAHNWVFEVRLYNDQTKSEEVE